MMQDSGVKKGADLSKIERTTAQDKFVLSASACCSVQNNGPLPVNFLLEAVANKFTVKDRMTAVADGGDEVSEAQGP